MSLLDPYPGESLRIFLAYDVGAADWNLGYALTYRAGQFGGVGSATLAAGNSWLAWMDAWENGDEHVYLDDPAEPVVISWVLEVLSGSGTIEVYDGEDPSFGDETVATPNALGTITVPGPGTYAIPAAAIPPSSIVDASTTPAYVARFVCTSGSLVVQQIKLRVWPPGGARGGWGSEPMPGFSLYGGLPNAVGANITTGLVGGETAATSDVLTPQSAAWEYAVAQLPGADGAPGPFQIASFGDNPTFTTAVGGTSWRGASPVYGAGGVHMVGSLGGMHAVATAAANGCIVVLSAGDVEGEVPIDLSLEEGVDWIRPPAEVPGDWQTFAQQLGARGYSWEHAVATVLETGPTPADPYVVEIGSTVSSESLSDSPIIPATTFGGPSFIALDMAAGGSVTMIQQLPVTVSNPVPLVATDRFIAVYVWSTVALFAAPWPGLGPFAGDIGWTAAPVLHFGQGDPSSSSFQPMVYRLTLPPYRIWDPAAAPDDYEVLQWAQRTDGKALATAPSWRNAGQTQHGARWGGIV